MMNRRRLLHRLALSSAALCLPAAAEDLRRAASGPGSADPDKGAASHWARLKFGIKDTSWHVDWRAHPGGDMRLVRAINLATTGNLQERWNVVDVENLDELIRLPFIFVHAQVEPDFSEQGRKNLAEYLERGGFLLVDDCVKREHEPDVFFQAMKNMLPELLPGSRWEPLGPDHPVFHCFYDFPAGQPHVQGKNHGAFGLIHRGRMVAYLTASDLHCGWVSAGWFDAKLEEDSLKMGVNIYVYAMTQ